jgi:hypothetical protein
MENSVGDHPFYNPAYTNLALHRKFWIFCSLFEKLGEYGTKTTWKNLSWGSIFFFSCFDRDNLRRKIIFLDDEYEGGNKKNELIIDRYFNPEGIEYLVHYVRKNIKLFDEKSFFDYKLAANLVDTDHEQILQHQRHFRG